MVLLSQPLNATRCSLPTRLVMAPMATVAADELGRVTDFQVEYYRRRAAAGGIGAIVVEHAYVHPQGRLCPKQLAIDSDGCIEGLSRLAHTVHACSPIPTLAILQLSHAGSYAVPPDFDDGIVAPSPLPHPGHKRKGTTHITPRAMDEQDIALVISSFAYAARRALEAGFDGVQVHAAHGYLLDQFYSPLTNLRSDAYGRASVENRARLTCDVLSAVRGVLGSDRTLWVRVGPHDYEPGGADASEIPRLGACLEAAGADLIDVSGGLFNFGRHDTRPPGFFRASSAAMKASVGVPVLTAGGVHLPSEAEWLLQTGACDLVGLGRALMRQPRWAARALEELALEDAGHA